MTPEDIDKLEAGRELDALIGEKVFNYDGICQVAGCSERHDPRYSTDIAAAWQVVEKLQSVTPGGDIHIECLDGQWEVSTCHGSFAPLGTDGWRDFSSADTAPLAICRAALKAVANHHQQPIVQIDIQTPFQPPPQCLKPQEGEEK